MIIIARESCLAMKPGPLIESVMDAMQQFKTCGYAEKLKTQITSHTLPSGDEDLLAFLYDQIINIWKL